MPHARPRPENALGLAARNASKRRLGTSERATIYRDALDVPFLQPPVAEGPQEAGGGQIPPPLLPIMR